MDADLIERLSEAAHNGWMAQKQVQGFADHAFEFNPGGGWCCAFPMDKHHNDMLPYADLAESTKEYDRATVRAFLRALDAEGLQIVQRAAHSTTPTQG